MKWYERWALYLISKGRCRVIYDHLDPAKPYLFRFHALFKQNRLPLGINVYLHQFLASDEGGLHDHPNPYVSIIISGGYWEHTPKGRFWRGAGSIIIRRAGSLHKVEIDPAAGPTWTLFFAGPRYRDWGFINEAGEWEQHDSYLKRHMKEPHANAA